MYVKKFGMFWLLSAIMIAMPGALGASQISESFNSIVSKRAEIVRAFSGTIANCVQRKDTTHPAFRGCIDWHSATHGTWALLAFERATRDTRYAELVDDILAPNLIELERQFLRANPNFEMPYGRAWFLRLAIEHGKTRGSTALVEMADELAISLIVWLRNEGPKPWARSYRNQSWALLNLLDYATYRRNYALIEEIVAITRTGFIPFDRPCEVARQRDTFMATCLTRALLVSRILKGKELRIWTDAFMSDIRRIDPILRPRSAHEYGLNYSRAWGLWELYAMTGDSSFARAFAKHFEQSYRDKSNWDGDYRKVGHWVAQFGVFALQPLFGPDHYR